MNLIIGYYYLTKYLHRFMFVRIFRYLDYSVLSVLLFNLLYVV